MRHPHLRAYVAPERPLKAEADSAAPSTQTLWAAQPWRSALGPLVAVRLRRGTVLQVGLRTSIGLHWLPPQGLLTEQQAVRWAETSKFSR